MTQKDNQSTVSNAYCMKRGWMEHDVFSSVKKYPEQMAWCWLVENAAWKQTKHRIGQHVVNLERGQLCYTMRDLADKWGWSKDSVNRFLNTLETETMIARKIAHKKTVITICNYDNHQLKPNHHETNVRQSRDNHETQKNKGNNNNNKNTITPLTPQDGLRPESTQDPEAPIIETKVYAFHGVVIKLLDKDLIAWQRCFNAFKPQELRFELERIDGWWQKQDPKAQKNWFMRTSKMLEKKNQQRLDARPDQPASRLAEEYRATAAPSINSPGFVDYMLKQTGVSHND